MSVSDTNICLLNTIELCVTVFRGPDAVTWSQIADSGVPDLLGRVQHYSVYPPDSLGGLHNALASLDDFAVLEPEFVRLFIAGPGGVPAPLYESCHLGTEVRTMGQSALDMRDRLTEAGLAVSLDSNEPPDHLSIEFEYLFHLVATGWSGGDPGAAHRGVAFAGEVMLPWVRRFAEALAKSDPHPVFLYSAKLAADVLGALAGTGRAA